MICCGSLRLNGVTIKDQAIRFCFHNKNIPDLCSNIFLFISGLSQHIDIHGWPELTTALTYHAKCLAFEGKLFYFSLTKQ